LSLLPLLPHLLLALLLIACGDAGTVAVAPEDGDGGGVTDTFSADFREVLVDGDQLRRPWGKALGDIDGDGLADALAGLEGGPISWYRFPDWERTPIGGTRGGDDLLVADVDGDGAPDVVTNGGDIAWYRNPHGTAAAPGAGWQANAIQPGIKGHDLVAADMDRDGHLDIVSRQEFGLTSVFLQRPGGSWRRIDLEESQGGTGLAVGDINGDGRLDVVENGHWLEQPPSPTQPWPRREFAAWEPTSAVAVADMDGDGRQDIMLSVGAGQGSIVWFRNPGPPHGLGWDEHRVGQADFVHRFHLADMDGDGDLDVAFAEQKEARDPKVGVFVNRGGGRSWDLSVVARAGAHNIALGDAGADGDLDILGADWAGDTRLKLWENLSADGGGAKGPAEITAPGGDESR
jgi:hypothetical protein